MAVLLSLSLAAFLFSSYTDQTSMSVQSIYDFEMTDIDGKTVSLSQFKGKKMMIVNVASRCGYTSQYADLQKAYEANADKAVILGFPANNFGGQEPGSDAEIKQFCTSKYSVTFPMFSKISVKGKDQHPLYQFLKEKTGKEPTWNFCKYIVSADGKTITFHSSGDKPQAIL